MGKQLTNLKLKDLYAIKHSLQRTVEEKEFELVGIGLTALEHDRLTEIPRLKKDIEHEKRLIKLFEDEIERFESYIRR